MKRLIYLTLCVIGMLMVHASAVAANGALGNFDVLAAKIHKSSMTKSQSQYSRQLHKSINAAAVQHLERTCARKHPGDRVQTFSMLGVMRLDGMFRNPVPLPDNAFTTCMADNMASVNFPLPPGNESGWPVALQFDGKTGRVLYMAGDRQPALPLYRQTVKRSRPWMYVPVPEIPKGVHKSCNISVWMSVGVHGRIGSVDVSDSSCPASMNKAVKDAALQWLYIGRRSESMDVRLSFEIVRSRVRVKL